MGNLCAKKQKEVRTDGQGDANGVYDWFSLKC